MKYTYIFFTFVIIFTTACVQKAYKRTVTFILHTAHVKDIKTVGIRGETPLSWRKDMPMTALKKDSLYTITLTGETGYKFTAIKFTINNEFELQGQENRRIFFSDKDTTYYEATFNTNN